MNISDPSTLSMIPGLDLKMVRPDLTGTQMTEEDDSTEANIYLAVCQINFFYRFSTLFSSP